MKRIFLFLATAFFLFITSTVNADADDYNKFYVGAGVSYGLEDIDFGDFDDSWGINAKIGYRPIDIIAVQFDFDYFDKFEDNDFFNGDAELEIMTYMLSLKGNFNIKWYNVISPYVIVGGGIMHVDGDLDDASIAGISFDASGDETDWCGKVGGGFDFYLVENFSLNLEGNYTFGGNDLEDIDYFQFILGGAFHFNLPSGNHKF